MSEGSERQPLLTQSSLIRRREVEATEVYPVIHLIRQDIIHFIDTPLSYDALTAPDLTYTLIRPLVDKYTAIQRHGNRSVVFCLLINRVRFQRDQNLASSTLSQSRAELCEILATRVLRDYGNHVLDLTFTLTTSWPVYAGANANVVAQVVQDGDGMEDRVGNAIEMAILSKAKRFIKSSSCQRVIDAIWSGKCVYQAESSHSILSDTYKRTPVHFYDPHKAPLLDHYRLKVPAVRSVLEYSNFLGLFILFVLAIELNELERINLAEGAFMVYALGFTLEKVAAMQEHGITVYFKGTWNGFDLAFVTTFCIYGFLRLYGVYHPNEWAKVAGIDFLALIACLMFPRLAFVTLKNNLMVLSLRSMIMQFLILMLIAAFCFCGFLYALWTLSRNEAHYSAGQIAWWMLDLWFGLDASGFDKATTFHPIFGPLLMVTYACLSNTLLLTVLVSILSHTFSTINEDAAAEAMFRKAVSTIEGVKADSLFSYQPPVNLLAVLVMLPASYMLSPRWFHKFNVFMIRLTSFPILLGIAWYERQAKRSGTSSFYETVAAAADKVFDTLPRQIRRMTLFEGLAGYDANIDAIFDIEDDIEAEIDGSALDTADYDTFASALLTSGHILSPATSPTSQRRLSGGKHVSSPKYGTNALSPTPYTPHTPGPRHRLSSVLHRGAEAAPQFISPLAQIYQPLIVDDTDDYGTNTGISYGPAQRRRPSTNLTNLKVPIPRRQDSRQPLSQSLDSKPFPTIGPSKRHHEDEAASQPETVGEAEEEAMRGEGPAAWQSRLKTIDERQIRMEEMLGQILQQLKTR